MGPTLSPQESRELADLRRRAYGPDPDADAAALARLQALEAAAHAAPVADAASEPDAAPVAHATPAVDAPSTAGATTPTAPPAPDTAIPWPVPVVPDPAPPKSGWRTRLRALPHRNWWQAGLAALLAAIAVWGAGAVSAPRADEVLTQIAPGEEGRAFARSSFLDNNDFDVRRVDRFESYGRLQVWVATATSGEQCLLIDADDYGIVGVSCTPADLDPVVDVRIWRGMRRDVFGDLPVNSVLRFVYSGDRVHLWVRSPAETA